MKIIIAGGGIGGLVTAMRLHQAGFQVKVEAAWRGNQFTSTCRARVDEYWFVT